MGCGQFCTNPGVLVGIASPEFDQMVEQITEIAAQSPPGVMLNAGIQKNYHHLVEQRSLKNSVAVRCSNGAVVFETSAQDFVEDPELHAELFGPACLIVRCLDQEEMNRVAESLEGQLTGSVFGYQPGPADELISVLTNRVGRLIFGAFPTGVEVCDAMHHGGPYPAASDSRFTSVGRAAIMRWARPVCWQNAPDSVLPAELQNANPLGIWRRIDSMFTNG
jgi:NADP-dependent aldehyde dehydrogenase